MAIYDDKTQDVIKSGNYFFINNVKSRTEAVFRASYIVGSNLYIDGKISAAFDLIVLGDVNAQDVDVKGKFICLGNCNVDNAITVQGKMFGKSIRAKHIYVHDDITAEEIDVDVLNVDGNITVEQTLAVKISAESGQKILCGETAYGAGTISAHEIITGEELDMDNGAESVKKPQRQLIEQVGDGQIHLLSKKYSRKNDYNSYLTELREKIEDNTVLESLERWKTTLNKVSDILGQSKFICYDIGILLSLIELSNSHYFSEWDEIKKWQQCFLDKFNKMANGEELEIPKKLTLDNLADGQRVIHNRNGIGIIKGLNKTESGIKANVVFDSGNIIEFRMDIAIKYFVLAEDNVLSPIEVFNMLFVRPKEYGEWISYLNILRTNSNMFSKNLYKITINLLYSAIGIKSKFILDRLNENGWKHNV